MFKLLLLVIIVVTGCKKSIPSAAKSPVGNWKWIYTYYDNKLSNSNPRTPHNTGNEELLTFTADNTFKHLKNNVTIDSGTYSYGHGIYINDFSRKFEYDSLKYSHINFPNLDGVDYYTISGDTLGIGGGTAGQYSSYLTPFGGSIWWIKQ